VLSRRTPLKARTSLRRKTPLQSRSELTARKPLERRMRLNPVSDKRKRQQAERRRLIAAQYPTRPLCAIPWCVHFADDIHEPLTRARGGSITDPANWLPLCRSCHDEVTFTPESELAWAYSAGVLVHSWDRVGAS
jgi:hypothetical protein